MNNVAALDEAAFKLAGISRKLVEMHLRHVLLKAAGKHVLSLLYCDTVRLNDRCVLPPYSHSIGADFQQRQHLKAPNLAPAHPRFPLRAMTQRT